jgi:hypothetical protein
MSMTTRIGETQQIDYATQALPDLFHASPEQFLFLLGRDGTKFLRFYWNEVGKKLNLQQLLPPFGMNFDIRKPHAGLSLALITLPKPQHEGEAYYIALIYRPSRRTLIFGLSDTTKVIGLEHWLDETGNERTVMAEYTRRLQREPIKSGLQPSLESFYKAILELLPG